MINFIPNENKLSPDIFSKLENLTGIKMPSDFINFYCAHNAIEGTGDLSVNIDGEPLWFDDLFSIDDMIEKYEELLEYGSGSNVQGIMIPFGYDSALNWFCFHYQKDSLSPIIIWISPEALFYVVEGSPSNGIIKVRNNFTDFLNDLQDEGKS